MPFSRELFIERDDFMIDPPRKYHRLGPGREVRLRYAWLVTCEDYETDADGNITTVYCRHDPESRGGNAPDGRKVRGTIHWVSARHAVSARVRLYDRLFRVENPGADRQDFRAALNPYSLVEVVDAKLEPSLAAWQGPRSYQFERLGYFCADPDGENATQPVFNRTVTLRDSWARQR